LSSSGLDFRFSNSSFPMPDREDGILEIDI
jgi:hypothetical protein